MESEMSSAAHKGYLVEVIAGILKSLKPVGYPLRGGLMLAYRPKRTFAAGRRGVYPSDTEIAVLVRDAKEAGLLLEAAPERREVPSGEGEKPWCVVEWTLETVQL